MGGCRCSFRLCPVASERNKGMHFFRFPTKQEERFKHWVKLAGVEHILNSTDVELFNKVICARHFHDTHFMNYKQNRLTISAAPTLHRLNEEYALDYSNDVDNPSLIKLPPITKPHLVPPEGFPSTMHFIAADLKLAESIINSYKADADSSVLKVLSATKRSRNSSRLIEKPKKQKVVEENDSTGDSCIVLFEENDTGLIENETISSSNIVLESDTLLEIIDVDEIKNLEAISQKSAETCELNNSLTVQYSDEKIKSSKKQQFILKESLNDASKISNDESLKNMEERLNKESQLLGKTKKDLLDSQVKISNLNAQLENLTDANEKLTIQLDISEKHGIELSSKLASIALEYNTLQRKHNELKIKYKDIEKQQQEQMSSSFSMMQQQQCQPQQQQQLTKAQLFNGIKKYLSQTMVALLRIQLSSGSTEREWKPDERRLAVDLLGLGDQVYKYFTDEWLIRLPSLRQIKVWRTEDAAFDEEDDI